MNIMCQAASESNKWNKCIKIQKLSVLFSPKKPLKYYYFLLFSSFIFFINLLLGFLGYKIIIFTFRNRKVLIKYK